MKYRFQRIAIYVLAVISVCLGNASAAVPTKTLPIVYVNTGGKTIEDTETQIPATVYIDPLTSGYDSLGSAQAPLAATLKGRGNYTWKDFDKKPYKLKFDVRQKVLGMPHNRHWCLMAGADDNLGFLRNPVGYMLSKAVGLRWTPRMRPVELVLNGQYKGLYFLTEHVRIAGHRVRIKEQADNETSPDSITGGWLVEIDNYLNSTNIEFYEGNGQKVMVSLREPEELSSAQRSYIEQQIYGLNDALYASSSARLEQMMDIDEAARYYLVQEIMEDCESYHGSCFLYKDRDSLGTTDKWKFGPVWDFGNAYNRHQEQWIYIYPTWPQYWIGQLASWPVFQKKVQEQWWIFYHEHKDSVRAEIQAFADKIETAAKRDADVWRNTQNYCDNSNFSDVRDRFLRRYDWRVKWLYSQWGEGIQPSTEGLEANGERQETQKILRNGQLYLMYKGAMYDVQGRKIDN